MEVTLLNTKSWGHGDPRPRSEPARLPQNEEDADEESFVSSVEFLELSQGDPGPCGASHLRSHRPEGMVHVPQIGLTVEERPSQTSARGPETCPRAQCARAASREVGVCR